MKLMAYMTRWKGGNMTDRNPFTEYRIWLDSLKPGQGVIRVKQSQHRVSRAVFKVGRVTKTMIILENDRGRFSRKSGQRVGTGRFLTLWIERATPTAINKLNQDKRRAELRNYIRGTNFDTIDIATLQKISDLLKKAKKHGE